MLGVWYGKAPGLDRAADAIRHGNWVGCGPRGGVLALVGDDPSSKSSTLPSASEAALADLGVPVLYPGSVQDVLDLGGHGYGLSRASGLWSAVKMVTNVADGVGVADVSPRSRARRRSRGTRSARTARMATCWRRSPSTSSAACSRSGSRARSPTRVRTGSTG